MDSSEWDGKGDVIHGEAESSRRRGTEWESRRQLPCAEDVKKKRGKGNKEGGREEREREKEKERRWDGRRDPLP